MDTSIPDNQVLQGALLAVWIDARRSKIETNRCKITEPLGFVTREAKSGHGDTCS